MKTILFGILFLITFNIYSAQTGKVGINNNNPAETLDVNGKTYTQSLYLKNPGEPTETGGSFLASNGTSVNTSLQRYPSDNKLFNYIFLTLNNVSNDGVTDLNTKISTTNFTLVVHNYSFKTSTGSTSVSLDHTSSNTLQGSPNIAAYKGTDGFWHIKANFTNSKFINVGGTVNNADRFTIELYMVAYRYLITKQNISDINTNLGGTNGNTTTYSTPVPTGF